MENDLLSLDTMSWVEIQAALPDLRLAIIPTGSCEQHGPHLALQTDFRIARELASRVARRLYPRAVLVPGVPWGISPYHMHFPGTVTLRPETVEAILSDLIKSLHEHGVPNFLIVNGHGGNGPVLRTMGYRLLVEEGIRIAAVTALALVSDLIKERVGSRHWGHSGEVETSLALYLAPDIVRTESLAAEDLKGLLDEIPLGRHDILFPRYFDELTSNGVWGDARLASREFGKELAEAAVEGIVKLAESLLRADAAPG